MKNIKKKIEDIIDITGETGSELVGGLISDALLGQIAPGLVSVIFSYKQKRMEKMILLALDEIKGRLNSLEFLVREFDDSYYIKEELLPIFFDYVIDETQEEKIQFLVNGLEYNLKKKNKQQDELIIYFDILKELRVSDIDYLLRFGKDFTVLGMYLNKYFSDENLFEEQIMSGTEMYMQNKLNRLGLIRIINSTEKNTNSTDIKIRLSKLGCEFIEYFRCQSSRDN